MSEKKRVFFVDNDKSPPFLVYPEDLGETIQNEAGNMEDGDSIRITALEIAIEHIREGE